mgnify:FL=1
MRIVLRVTAVCLFSIFSYACKQLNDEKLFGIEAECDTTNVSYKLQILPILQNNCLTCHNEKNNINIGAGINLEGHENARFYALNNSLLGSIQHKSGYSPMPKNMPKLNTCSINQIKSWIIQGAPNN